MVDQIVALLTLLVLEIVLGIDNVIFIAILSGKLPEVDRAKARRLGIGLAVITRILLLLSLSWVLGLTEPLFTIPIIDKGISGRDVILLGGGLFLIAKSTKEIHEKLEAADTAHANVAKPVTTLAAVVIQIMLVDVVFSLDSVITAIGIADEIYIMIAAILIAAAVMIFFANRISQFVEDHPTMKILALAFLILIGSLLVIEGWAHEAAEELQLKNYAYFAMAFSVFIELINMRVRKPVQPVKLHNRPHISEIPEEGYQAPTSGD